MATFLARMKEEFRVESRLNVALPIKIAYAENSSNLENLCTYDISRCGGRIVMPRTAVKPGQLIWVSRKTRKARFKVAWVGADGTHQAKQIGVHCVDSGPCIWDEELQKQF